MDPRAPESSIRKSSHRSKSPHSLTPPPHHKKSPHPSRLQNPDNNPLAAAHHGETSRARPGIARRWREPDHLTPRRNQPRTPPTTARTRKPKQQEELGLPDLTDDRSGRAGAHADTARHGTGTSGGSRRGAREAAAAAAEANGSARVARGVGEMGVRFVWRSRFRVGF